MTSKDTFWPTTGASTSSPFISSWTFNVLAEATSCRSTTWSASILGKIWSWPWSMRPWWSFPRVALMWGYLNERTQRLYNTNVGVVVREGKWSTGVDIVVMFWRIGASSRGRVACCPLLNPSQSLHSLSHLGVRLPLLTPIPSRGSPYHRRPILRRCPSNFRTFGITLSRYGLVSFHQVWNCSLSAGFTSSSLPTLMDT